MADSLAQRVRAGERRAVARAVTVIENRSPESDTLLRELFPHSGRAVVLGITGPPGAGKSTLTDQLVRALRREGKRVAVLAVDPTSPFSGGAILGDRIRMQEHHADDGVFIRSLATRGALGGLSAATGDLAMMLDAAGWDWVLIETVGVGQDEVEIAQLARAVLVVLVPGMGDDVQAIKAGIMEVADVFVLNKADQPGIERLEREVQGMLSLGHGRDADWHPPVFRTVAAEGHGIPAVLGAVREFLESPAASRREVLSWRYRLRALARERLENRVDWSGLMALAESVALRRLEPRSAVDGWLAGQEKRQESDG